MTAAYDIIGDVHGQAKKLVALLKTLGYRASGGVWRHPARKAVFVGDLIDRGPLQLETLEIVRPMVEGGVAHCVLGNHEFNAIAWATPHPQKPGDFLRSRRRESNRAQHRAFLAEVEDTPAHDQWIAWFKTLPLWLDFGSFRVVHACWNDDYMNRLRPHLGPGAMLTDELTILASREGHWAFAAVEALCKGLEVDLPDGAFFHDKDGHIRRSARIKWWAPDFSSLRNSTLAPASVLADMPDIPLPRDPRLAPYDGPPVFFGHYWRGGAPKILAENAACVDYSAGKGGPLVAYRWSGEAVLRDGNFVAAG
ncbi:metallophosphoesterase [Rhodoblastus sp.]|uniref:metallophosphoesterase n=1 Tax=Rhodoblastus sp. TaxID=1962975 RepID=UPI003F9468D2